MVSWNDADAAKAKLQELYPELPKIIIERAYALWDQSRCLSDKDRRKANAILDQIPDNVNHLDYADVETEITGVSVD